MLNVICNISRYFFVVMSLSAVLLAYYSNNTLQNREIDKHS